MATSASPPASTSPGPDASSARAAVGLKDVAAHAGVSIKTVSNVVHGYEHVSAATRSRVQSAIAELNYVPNLAARSLRTQRSGLIALALPEIDGPYYAEIARLIVDAAAARGFTVLIDQTGGEREREELFVSGIRAQLIDASILTPVTMSEAELLARRQPRPLVLLGESVEDGAIPQVSIDSRAAGRAATDHLIGLGRRRVAALGAPAGDVALSAHLRRLAGYRDALAAAGLAPDESLIAETVGFQAVDGFAAMRRLLELSAPPDAVFCFNDVLALGAMRALHVAGRRIPDDVAVIGFDDIAVGRYSTPTLSTIAPDKAAIAQRAVDDALRQLEAVTTEPPAPVSPTTAVTFRLEVRESTVGRESSRPGPI